MRRLEAVRLVQWYHFQDETFPIGGSCLLLGDNGSGKTTVLDAIQVALVADLSEVMLNRAANEKSRRTLHGYVRWKIGSEDELRPGAVRYGRAGCTSYVMLQFCDDLDVGSSFTCGIAFEATESSSDVAKLHFLMSGVAIHDVLAVLPSADGHQERVVQPLREFRAWLRQHGGACWTDTGTYREELRQRLGVLPESFHRLVVKALAFKPIGQVRQFVFEYLLDPRPIDTASLQANLEHYKRLEGEAEEARKRVGELDEIVREGERIRTEQRTAESHRYMEFRADGEAAQAQVDRIKDELVRTQAMLQGLKARGVSIRDELEALARQRERVNSLLEGHEAYRQLRDLERELEDAERRLREAQEADEVARRLLLGQTRALDALLSEEARALRRTRSSMFEREDIIGAEEPPDVLAQLRSMLASEGALTNRDLVTWERRLGGAAERLHEIRTLIQQEIRATKTEGATLQEEQRTLEAGRQQYPNGPSALLHLLRARLKGQREAKPLCELIEVPNARWRDAVEGYLNTRRFDVIVAPEDYPRALSLYERNKRDYALPGKGNVFIGGVGLVDIERMVRMAARCERHSLAEQVDTKDPYARIYCDFVLGEVICVDDEQSLRKHKAAITDTVMVYRGHVARQTPREIFTRHYIGEAARIRRLHEIGARLADLSSQMVSAVGSIKWLDPTMRLLDNARADARRLSDLVARAEGLATLNLRVRRLAEQKGKIDRGAIQDLERERDAITKGQDALASERDEVQKQLGSAEKTVSDLSGQLESVRCQVKETERVLQRFAESLNATTRETYEQRYVRERLTRTPAEIQDVFEQQRKRIESRVGNLVQKLVELKTRYVERRGFIATVEGDKFEEFASELETWRDSRLPEYRDKISEAKTKALQQLAEDIVFRLRENLILVRRQIDELNRALQDVPFGSERYQFTVELDPEHADFYNLVMGAGLYDKESLFGNAAMENAEFKSKLRELLDRLVEAEARQVKTDLEAKADYREYFRYDLKIHHADGTYSLYDRVAADKSGGETQTPYYIAILASMYRLYRSRSRDDRPCCGLVLLDEAFGKMDESRIAATLTFARRLGLQLVLATPKERSELVAPKVERSLLIHKDPISGLPIILDFTKEFPRDEREDAVSEDGDPHPAAANLRA